MKVTCTNGSNSNGIRGSRITIYNSDGTIQDRFVVPKHFGIRYCQKHPTGEYGERYFEGLRKAK